MPSDAVIITLITAVAGVAAAFFTYRAAMRKDLLATAMQMIEDLQAEVKTLKANDADRQEAFDKERKKRRDLELALDDEKIARGLVESDLKVTRRSLEQKTQASADRQERVEQLETLTTEQARRIVELEERLKKVERKTGPLDPKEGG
jgi:chromosome segregation ATPase